MQFHRTSIYQYPIEEKISDLSVHSNTYKCCSPVSKLHGFQRYCFLQSGSGKVNPGSLKTSGNIDYI